MATIVPTRTDALSEGQCVEWHGLDWKGYTTLLRLRGERPSPRMVYLDGSLYLVSPAYRHERPKKLLGAFIQELFTGLRIPCIQAGSTTFRRRSKRGGVQGDETYYLTHAGLVRGKQEIDLRTDPPPDLAIEVVHTHAAEAAIEVYRRLGVPEVWVFERSGLRILVLQPKGQYAEAVSSVAFPFLKASEILEWVTRPESDTDTDWTLDLRDWVRDVLVPRRAQLERGADA